MKKFLFYFAAAGWFLGLIVHLLSIAGMDVMDKVPFVWFLHIGIFVVWIPVVIDLKRNKKYQEYQESGLLNRMNPSGFFKVVLRETPLWLKVIVLGGLFYAVVNFMLFMMSQNGVPEIMDGQYVLNNHGQLIRGLTPEEYHHFKADELRGFSGHWTAFYGLAAAILYPFRRKSENE